MKTWFFPGLKIPTLKMKVVRKKSWILQNDHCFLGLLERMVYIYLYIYIIIHINNTKLFGTRKEDKKKTSADCL